MISNCRLSIPPSVKTMRARHLNRVRNCLTGAAYLTAHSPPGVEHLEQRLLFAETLDVPVGAGGAQSVTFTDADGTTATLSMRGRGTGSIHFIGEALAQAADADGVVVTGTAIGAPAITATATSRKTRIMIEASGGDGSVTISGISSDGPISAVEAPSAVLGGPFSAGGQVRRMSWLHVTNGTVTSPDLGRITVNGDFQGALSATRARSIDIAGTVSASTFTLDTSLGRLRVGGEFNGSKLSVGSGGIGTIVVKRNLINSYVFAGVRPLPEAPPEPNGYQSPAPSGASDFLSDARIGKIDIEGPIVAVQHSVVAASRIGRVRIAPLTSGGGGGPKSVFVARRIGRSVVFAGTGPYVPVHRPRLTRPGTVIVGTFTDFLIV